MSGSRISTLACAIFILSSTVNGVRAVTLDTTAGISIADSPFVQAPPSVAPVTPGIVDQNSGPTAESSLVTDPRLEAEARSAATADGQLAASASFNGAQGKYAHVSASSSWTETFDATAGSSAVFDFFIPQALIGFGANNVPNLYGGFSVDILLNGSSVFSASAEVLTQSGFPATPADMPLNQTGPLTSSFSSTGVAPGFGAGYVFDAYGDSLNLAPVAGSNVLTYTMTAFVIGLIGETSAIAYIGDPLSLAQSGGNSEIPGSVLTLDNGLPPVPLPAAFWLFGTALLGFIGISRRRKL